MNEVRYYGLLLVLSQKLILSLSAHFAKTLVKDAATSCRRFGLIRLVFLLDNNLFLLTSSADHLKELAFELFTVTLKFVGRVSNLGRLTLLI